MKKTLLITALAALNLFALTGEEILDKMDINRDYKSIEYSGSMDITIGKQKRTKTMRANAMGGSETKAVVEYTNPEDRGTKYLMLADNLWIYFPEEDDVVKISGHMLKEGMMGSDVSYEDALESDKLSDKYKIEIVGDTTLNEKECWKINLTAKVKKVPYFKRTMVVDKVDFVCLREQMFSKSGKLMKESTVLETKEFDGRIFATKSKLENKLRRNSSTIFTMEDLKFDVEVDESMFTMRYLGQ
jgi:outer membrane lipoprotein-sorting protein